MMYKTGVNHARHWKNIKRERYSNPDIAIFLYTVSETDT